MRSVSELLAKCLLKAGLQSRLCFKARIQLNGIPVEIPLMGNLGYGNLDCHEPWMEETLRRLLPLRSGTFLDVGSNIGQTLVKVKSLDPGRAYVGVEPNPSCVCYLEMLIKANQYTDCEIIPAALSRDHGIIKLDLYGDAVTDASASMIKDFRQGVISSSRPIATCTYLEIARELELADVGFVKIDVEGAEWEVIQSLENLLTTGDPILLMEVLPVYSGENSDRLDRQKSIESLLNKLDYVFYRVVKGTDNGLIGVTAVSEIGIHSDLCQCDYIVVPRESESEMCSAIRVKKPEMA